MILQHRTRGARSEDNNMTDRKPWSQSKTAPRNEPKLSKFIE